MKTEELKIELNKTLYMLQMLEDILVSSLQITDEELLKIVSMGILRIFPDIVECYELEEMIEYKDQQTYWLEQMERIVEALERGDRFYQIDVLTKETKESLLELKTIIQELT